MTNVDDELMRHDGLFVDYDKFNDLAKDMLKNANVVRQKDIRSPKRILRGSEISRNTSEG